MDVTTKCIISGQYGFELTNANRYVIIDVEAKNGDLIKVNKVNGVKYSEIWAVVETPRHEEQPIIDEASKIIVIGGENKQSKRTIVIVGK